MCTTASSSKCLPPRSAISAGTTWQRITYWTAIPLIFQRLYLFSISGICINAAGVFGICSCALGLVSGVARLPFAAAWLIWRKLGSDRLAGCMVAAVWALGGAAGESLALGQVGPQLTLLLAAAYTLSRRGPGECVGTGFAVKIVPGVLCVIFALRRNFRALLRAVVIAFLLTVVPWVLVVCCLAGPKAPCTRIISPARLR